MSINESARALPGIFVSREVINKRVKLFMENKYPLLLNNIQQRVPGGMETKSIWYPKTHIETWLQEMNEMGANGMRVYFGEYETDGAGNSTSEAHLGKPHGQLCLLMVLTREGKAAGSLTNIIYEEEAGYEARLANTITVKSANTDGVGNDEKDKQFNFGAFCPPICLTESNEYPNIP